MKKISIPIYGSFLALCFLNFFGSVHAAKVVDIKIDFARVQDVSGDQPNKKTAACIIIGVANDAEEKVFCRYELNKNREFWRDNTEVNNILYTKTGKLFTATSKKVLEQKINEWLANIEKGLSRKKLPPIHSKISQLFDEFIKQGVNNYSAYSGYETGLFKNTKPYDLVLLKKLDAPKIITYETFAFLAHYEIHRVVSVEPNMLQNLVDKYGKGFLEVLKRPDINQLLGNKAIVELLSKPEIVTFLKELDQKHPSASAVLTNEDSRSLLEEYADILKIAGIDKLLVSDSETKSIIEVLRANPGVVENIGGKNFIVTDDSFIVAGESSVLERVVMLVIVLVVCGVLLLLVVIVILLRQSRKSQKRMNGIVGELHMQIDDSLARRTVSQKVTLDAQQSKREILRAIFAQKAKVQQEHDELKQSRVTAENKLTKTQQHLTTTKGKLSQTQTKLVEVQNQYKRITESLKPLMIKRFGVAKPELLPQMSEQEGTWRWLQSVLTAQYKNYHDAFSNVENLHDPECDKILDLLNIKSILTHWHGFITENPHLESDQRLLGLLEERDAGMWLSNILRADELLKTYFSDKAQLESLITPLAIAAMMLQAALKELGVEVIKPALLETPPANLPQSARKKAENPILMELVHGKVMPKLESQGKLVVDVERYGFVTQGTPKTAMKVLVADLGGWEFFQ